MHSGAVAFKGCKTAMVVTSASVSSQMEGGRTAALKKELCHEHQQVLDEKRDKEYAVYLFQEITAKC